MIAAPADAVHDEGLICRFRVVVLECYTQLEARFIAKEVLCDEVHLGSENRVTQQLSR